MKVEARNSLIAVSSIGAIALGVALALPPSSSATAEDDSQNEVQESERDPAVEETDSADDVSSTVEPDPACTDESGEPLPTVSNPCWAEANSNRAQALTCGAIASNDDASLTDRRWFVANCEGESDDYEVVSRNQHGFVLKYAGETFYLGNDCDVRSTTFGSGHWEWANGGWLMDFKGGDRIDFARRDSPSGEEACRS
jgi:hypothetical protein